MLSVKDKNTLNILNEIGWSMFLAGDAEGAELVLQEGMQKRVEVLTECAGLTQHTFQNLAACLTKLHIYKEAEELYKKAGSEHVWRYIGEYTTGGEEFQLGDDHPDTLPTAVNLARVYFKLNRREDAASLARRTRVRFERVFG